MARTKNVLLIDMQGGIAKQLVVRKRNGKAFVSKYPDMSNVKPSAKQKKEQNKFREAVNYAREFTKNPSKKLEFKVRKDQSVYNAAIQHFYKKSKAS